MLIFVHGLNTYGDDDVHVGPLKFGRMHARLEEGFRKLGIDFLAIENQGAGSPSEQAIRAIEFIKAAGLPASTELHLLGQSTGGLVAREMAAHPELRSRVRTVMTVGTPHHGTIAASFGLEFARKHPVLSRLFKTFGYDTNAKNEIFRHFTPESAASLNARLTPLPGVREVSLICEVGKSELSWPLLFFYDRLHPVVDAISPASECKASGRKASDGFVWSESQKHGEPLGPFALDHFGELGFFFQTSKAARERARKEFERLLQSIASLVSK